MMLIELLACLKSLRYRFGIIENMAYLPMPDGTELHVFGENGGEHLASLVGARFLGRIPIDPAIGKSGDIGSPWLYKNY